MLPWCVRLYALLLQLYPTRFRAEFVDEMQVVFAEAATEAAKRGRLSLATLCLRELRGCPLAVIGEHLRERTFQRMNTQSQPSSNDQPVSLAALLVMLALFSMPALFAVPAIGWGLWVRNILPLLTLVLVLGAVLVGAMRGLPRWSLPHFGAVLSFLILLAIQSLFTAWDSWWGQVYRRLVNPSDMLSRLLWQFHLPVLFWLFMLVTVALALFVFALVNPLRPLYQRLRQDWTQVSFALYGAAMAMFLVDFDDYQHEAIYMLACMVCLAAGAWAYLRSSHPRRRIAVLLAGVTLAMLTMGVAKWLIVPMQDWPFWFTGHPPASERWFEALRTIPAWLCMMAALAAPALLGRGLPTRTASEA